MGFVSGVIDNNANTIFLPHGLGIIPTAATLEVLVNDANLMRAWDRVRRNRGAPGVDGETIESFEASFSHRLPLLQADLLASTFRPQPVRAFQISKPSGGMRTLGIPTVTDRVVLEAIAQILTPVWELAFSPFSFAYRPGQDAHAAVITAQRILQTGYRWVVDLDIEKFFDNVDHVRLMQRLGRRVADVRILDLIADFLRAGQSWNGEVRPTRVGIAQGSPLSPLLANIVLDELDEEFARCEWPFVRYADDCILFARSESEGRDILSRTGIFLWSRLHLRLNSRKSRVSPPERADHLGFTYRISRYGYVRRRTGHAALETFRNRIDALTCLQSGKSWEQVCETVAAYLRGWSLYYGDSQDDTLRAVRSYARSRLRACAWEMWRTPEKREWELRRRGIPDTSAEQAAFALLMPDELASLPVLSRAFPNNYFERFGLGDSVSGPPRSRFRSLCPRFASADLRLETVYPVQTATN
jgi:RNA-directed DNA polymerase